MVAPAAASGAAPPEAADATCVYEVYGYADLLGLVRRRAQLQPCALQVLLRDGPAAAYPALALAISVMPSPTTTELAIYRFCKAAADRDPDTTLELGRIELRRGPPASLAPVFRDYQ